jgi:hypothetical protein
MPREALTAIAAGMASAAAAMALLTGAFLTIGIVYMAPLPMLMAGLALGPRAATIAVLTGVATMGFAGGTALAGLFAVVHGVPTWAVVRLALSPRIGGGGAGGTATAKGGTAADAWMAPGWIVGALAVFAAGLVALVAIAVSNVGLSEFVAQYLEQAMRALGPGAKSTGGGELAPLFGMEPISPEQFARATTPLFPGTAATSWVVMVTVNAVVAQGLLVRIGHNRRPSPSYVGLDLPMWMSWPLVGAALMALVGPGQWEYVGRNLAMVLALPYFFLGLAVVHTAARRVSATTLLLVAFYLVMVMSIWAALVVVGIGIVEQWFGLRGRFGPGLNRNDDPE